jgi:hypothetical protein
MGSLSERKGKGERGRS